MHSKLVTDIGREEKEEIGKDKGISGMGRNRFSPGRVRKIGRERKGRGGEVSRREGKGRNGRKETKRKKSKGIFKPQILDSE